MFTSPKDNVVLAIEKNGPAKIWDVAAGKHIDIDESIKNCEVSRQYSTENTESNPSLEDFKLALSCQNQFKIITVSGTVLYETASLNQIQNGGISKFYNSGAENLIVQF